MVRVYKDGFFSKNGGALSRFGRSMTCFLGRRIKTYDGYGEINGELF